MRALTPAWTSSGGTVLGLAPSAVAAAVLAHETGTHADTGSADAAPRAPWRYDADTLAKLTHALATGTLPAWAQQVDARTLVLVDEAGMASTADLATVLDSSSTGAASVRLIGDDRQLASVAAGGVLRDIARPSAPSP